MPVPRLISARQAPIFAYIDVVLANVATAVSFNLFEVPAGAIIMSGGIITTAVFNSTTSDVIDIGDSGSANRYLNDGTIHALGHVPLVPTYYLYTAPTKISGLWVSGGGVPTTGAFTAYINYIVKGRGQFAQGQDSLG